MNVTVYNSEQEAWDYLNTDQDCAVLDPEYLYRGQANRHLRLWPPKDLPMQNLTKHQYELDSIIPTDYRGLEDAVADGTASNNPLFTNEAAILRSVLTWGAIDEHGRSLSNQDHQDVIQWLNKQSQEFHRFDAVGSVGQHYGLMTGYTDASSSLEVAFWMATRHFRTGDYMFSGNSVVYRWRLNTLRMTLRTVNAVPGWTISLERRVVDIRNIPPQIGSRPKNQSGWSLINCELLSVYDQLSRCHTFEAVVFSRTGPCQRNNLTLDFIKPSGENIIDLFDDIIQGKLYSPVRQQILDQWRQKNPGILQPIDLRDPQIRHWVIR